MNVLNVMLINSIPRGNDNKIIKKMLDKYTLKDLINVYKNTFNILKPSDFISSIVLPYFSSK